MAAEGDEVHAAFDAGLEELQPLLGQRHGSIISGHERLTGPEVVERSPVDTDVLIGRFVEATAADVAEAVGIAKAFAPTWADTPWRDRVRLLEAGADLISERRNVISALLTVEVGKNRLESLGDVEETADLIRYYNHQLVDHDGFEQPMGRLNPAEATSDVLRPYGVWAVVAPFNFPAALSGGPQRRWRPATRWWSSRRRRASAPRWPSCAACSTGHPVRGAPRRGRRGRRRPRWWPTPASTGSRSPAPMRSGWSSTARPPAYPRPVICEMGGKNPVIVSREADLDVAAEGRPARPSACPAEVLGGLPGLRGALGGRGLRRAAGRAGPGHPAGRPRDRDTYLGPVVDEAALSGSSGLSTRRRRRARCWPVATGSPTAHSGGVLRRADRGAGPADELGRDLRAVRAARRRRRRRLGRQAITGPTTRRSD
jgi:1-pyrroline-5-carboxylate dehydrogenase